MRNTFTCGSLLILATLASPTVMAEKHGHKEHQNKHQHAERHDDRPHDTERDEPVERQHYFNDQHRGIVRDYYTEEYRSGHCPPGLAKKHNGCLPPGQAKRWVIGRPLPRNVVYYDLPPHIIQSIGYPPPGYRYVRVASDILMIAIGSGLVLDAIADLNGFQ